MAIPALPGWIIDYLTARAVYAAADNQLIHCWGGMCHASDLWYCMCEHTDFRQNELLKPPFVDQGCKLVPSDGIMTRVLALAQNGTAKPVMKGDRTTLFLAASALELGYGVISDRQNPRFCTVHDVAAQYGFLAVTSADFKAFL